ncbi:immunoglobulin-like domain-containing protein, partial [Bacillus cereus]|uniref:immunoglobulin-like domain-containing protein n=1 Tax=Bacillus cereus TaxID=1396 RepID=UPI001F4F569D
VFEVAAINAKGVESTKTKGTVLGNPVQAPTISKYYTTDAFAKGNAPGASKVAIYVDGKLVRTAAVEADGTYKIYTGDIPTLQKEGSVFEIAARNAAGKESEKVKGTVAKVKVNITANEYHLGIDNSITGTSDSGITKVKVVVDDTILRQAVTSDGAYSIYAKDIVKGANQKVEIAGFNSMNQEVNRTKVTVK